MNSKKRKKVYIICGKEEYNIVWEHLHEIIDVLEEELIIPLGFMEPEKINDENNWYNYKFLHFMNYAQDANRFIITKNYPLNNEYDRKEKLNEIEICEFYYKPIEILDLKKLTYQKTIK